METDSLQKLSREDERLAVGAAVVARWSEKGFFFRARGRVVRLTRRQVEVELLERPSGGNDEFRAGSLITLPRLLNHAEWSSENCVRLLSKGGGRSASR